LIFGPGKWATFIPNSLILSPGELEEVIVNISIPSDIDEGSYSGTIYEYAEDEDGNAQIKSTSLIVHVRGLVLKINISLAVERDQACPGESISAFVDIATNHPDYLDVNLTYQILDPDDNVIDQSTENITFNGTTQTNPSFILPNNATLGYYTFMTFIEHNLTRGNAYDMFEVIPCVITPPAPTPGAPAVPPVVPPIIPVYNITLNLSTDILHAIIGEKTSFIASVDNVGTEKVEYIKLSIDGISLRWIAILPYMSDISPGEKQDYLVKMSIPENAEPGVYELKVKATDDIESNIKILKLIIGRDPKEVTDLLFLEVEKVRMNANESLLVEECLDITLIRNLFKDVEKAYDKALKEYENENYEESINWLEYAIPIYEKVVNTVDIALELEIKASEKSLITISNLPSIFELEKEFKLAKTYLKEKNYKEICIPILRMRRLVMMSLIFWPGIIILIIVLIIVTFVIYRKMRRKERVSTLEEIEKRLKTT